MEAKVIGYSPLQASGNYAELPLVLITRVMRVERVGLLASQPQKLLRDQMRGSIQQST